MDTITTAPADTTVSPDLTIEVNTLLGIRTTITGAYDISLQPGHLNMQGNTGEGLEQAITALGLTYRRSDTREDGHTYHRYIGPIGDVKVCVCLVEKSAA